MAFLDYHNYYFDPAYPGGGEYHYERFAETLRFFNFKAGFSF